MTQPIFVSNGILYSVQFAAELDDGTVDRVARSVIENPSAYLSTEQMYEGIAGALASDATLTELIPGHRHSEQEYRDFLGKVLRRLDAMRPWPKRPFQQMDPLSWGTLDSVRLIARIKLSTLGVQRRLHKVFGEAEDGREVIALRLNSGTEVAIIAEWWPGSKDAALVLRHPGQAVAGVIEEFCAATGITSDEIEAVGGA